jgi:hypothetical protein
MKEVPPDDVPPHSVKAMSPLAPSLRIVSSKRLSEFCFLCEESCIRYIAVKIIDLAITQRDNEGAGFGAVSRQMFIEAAPNPLSEMFTGKVLFLKTLQIYVSELYNSKPSSFVKS